MGPRTLKVLSNVFDSRNVFGWFISIHAEKSISRLLEAIDSPDFYLRSKPRDYYKWKFSGSVEHRLGVDLLASRNEKLHFEGPGLTKHLFPRSSEVPHTQDQRKRWTNAFETLAANLLCVVVVHFSAIFN